MTFTMKQALQPQGSSSSTDECMQDMFPEHCCEVLIFHEAPVDDVQMVVDSVMAEDEEEHLLRGMPLNELNEWIEAQG